MKEATFNLSRLQRCESDLVRIGLRKPVVRYNLEQIMNYLCWLYRFHPELRERVKDDIEDVIEVQKCLRDGTDPWCDNY